MAIKSNLESIEENGGDNLIKRDQAVIRQALSTTAFVYDGFMWITKDEGLTILDWLTYEIDTVLSATVLSSFVEKLLQLEVDGENDNMVRNLGNEALVNILSDLRYAKGTGDVSIYHKMLSRNGFIVFDPSVQIERICHTVRTEMEYRMQR
jgi:hypothetical protein